ncbi:MAG TPA: UvrD-helicase domain-containing protein [Solirubrobacteraceae bacterium]|nr:UvrD-helicase domain-containing protein [Solirubrobacteraceae bacterium]
MSPGGGWAGGASAAPGGRRSQGTPPAFDPCGPLPRGVTVLEASAGTGKTHTISSLAARYVAEGTPLERLLLVTFTRLATGELRERVRRRLVEVERGLALAIATGVAATDDPVVALLAAADAPAARRRLELALAGFDAATVATTHAFCQEVLSGLGISGDLEPEARFETDISDLIDEVVDDLYVRRFARGQAPPRGQPPPRGEAPPSGQPPPFSRAEAGRIARAAIANPDTPIAPAEDEVGAMRVRLALAARDELERRKRAMSLVTYDDLVVRLRAALDPQRGRTAASRLRERFDVVLVDEFQDTDPSQWEILRCAFGETGATLVVVADPKQAIYAFRGADVYAYLAAARAADARATLTVNWRSDRGLVDALDALFGGARLGHEQIVPVAVSAAPAHQRPGLTGAHASAPLRVRILQRDSPDLSLTRSGDASAPSARALIADDLVSDVVALLSSGATVATGAGDGTDLAPGASEPIRPAHLAVLVRTNRQASEVRDALARAGVPAVVSGSGSVFASRAALDWQILLDALERPESAARARAAVLTPFVGWSAARLDEAGEDEWARARARLHRWGRLLRQRGVASLMAAIELEHDERPFAARLLERAGGERLLTDLRHVGRLLQGASQEQERGPAALGAWLGARIAEADQEGAADEERTRRLESDAQAVQVLTIHRSKGLEFPVVYVPYPWEPGYLPRDPEPVVFHDSSAGDRRTLDVALCGRTFQSHRRLAAAEQRGEDLRLLYVALTRARHQVVLWWAGSHNSRQSPLCRLLFSRSAEGDIAAECDRTPSDAEVRARLRSLADRTGGAIAVERATLGLPAAWSPPAEPVAELRAASFGRSLDARWRRTSYSAITAAAHELDGPRDEWVASEPEIPVADADPDESREPVLAAAGRAGSERGLAPAPGCRPGAERPSPLAALPAGADVGTLVHEVLRATDFAAADLRTELERRIAAARRLRSVPIGSLPELVDGLQAAIETPLGSIVGGRSLHSFARADRLDELAFELPLAGGDRPRGQVAVRRIAALLSERLDAADPLAAYAQRLDDPALERSVRGYLTGSLDLVLRVREDGEQRYAVVDHKTNRLAGAQEPLTLGHYRPQALLAEMIERHYALQGLLYLVALHRFLRWRLDGYHPDRHLAGFIYTFLRGMSGGDGAEPAHGVFAWRPPAGLVPALSDLLDGSA